MGVFEVLVYEVSNLADGGAEAEEGGCEDEQLCNEVEHAAVDDAHGGYDCACYAKAY